MNIIKSITIGNPTILNNEFVLFVVDLQTSLVFDNDNGLIAKATNYDEKITIHNGIDDEKIDNLLKVLKTTLNGSSYNIGTYARNYTNLNNIKNAVKFKVINWYGKEL